MYIEELRNDEEVESVVGAKDGSKNSYPSDAVLEDGRSIVFWDAKRALVGAGARALFYPTLLYNVVRNKIQSEFRWWDRVDKVSAQVISACGFSYNYVFFFAS